MDVATRGPGTFKDEFAEAFRTVKLPVLPAAVSRLLAEVNSPEAEVGRIERIIAAEPLISAKVLRTINSSHFALRTTVTSIRHAVALLGLDRIRSIVLSYAILESVPHPPTTLFKHEAFWTDTLLRSLLARILSRRSGLGDEDEAFTAMMLADIAGRGDLATNHPRPCPCCCSTWIPTSCGDRGRSSGTSCARLA